MPSAASTGLADLPTGPAPLEGPWIWAGHEQAPRTDWIVPFGAGAVAEIEAAVAAARAGGYTQETLTPEAFPLPSVARRLAESLRELDRGRGFVLLRGLPVERWGDEDTALAFVGLGRHMGTPSSQNAAGDLLGHVRDTGADPADPSVRLYRTRERLAFHTDGADVIGLLCLRSARTGGSSRLVSSGAVYNEVCRRRPDLAPLLFEPFPFDRNEEQRPGEAPFFQLPLCQWDGSRLRTFYIGWYIRDAERHDGVALSASQRALLDLIDEIAESPRQHLEMELRPGDLQLVKNSAVLHARTHYEDHHEPQRKRHLLRLWLTPHEGFADGSDFLRRGIPARPGASPDDDAPGADPRA